MPGGWSVARVERVKNAQIPQTLRCKGCNRFRPQNSFSNAQLLRLRDKLASASARGRENVFANHNLRCRACTGSETPDEITCMCCRKRKNTEDFFKVQRRNLDTATCINCVSDGQMARPWDDNGATAEEDDEYYQSHDEGDDDTLTVVGSTVGGVSLGSERNGYGFTETGSMYSRPSLPSMEGNEHRHSDDGEDLESVAGGAYLEHNPAQSDTSSLVSISIANSSTVKTSASTVSTSEHSLQGDYAWQLQQTKPRSRPRPKPKTSSKGGKWAKIRAHDPYRHAREMRIPEPSEVAEEDNEQIKAVPSFEPPEEFL